MPILGFGRGSRCYTSGNRGPTAAYPAGRGERDPWKSAEEEVPPPTTGFAASPREAGAGVSESVLGCDRQAEQVGQVPR